MHHIKTHLAKTKLKRVGGHSWYSYLIGGPLQHSGTTRKWNISENVMSIINRIQNANPILYTVLNVNLYDMNNVFKVNLALN